MPKQKGFTLLELLIVLAIIALGTAFLAPKLNSDTKIYDAQIRQLIAILKYSRRMAVITNQVQQATLHPKIINTDTKSDGNASQKRDKGHWYSKTIDFQWQTSSGNIITDKVIGIDFFPQGGATEGELFLSLGDIKNKIHIDGFTGKVTLSDMEDDESL